MLLIAYPVGITAEVNILAMASIVRVILTCGIAKRGTSFSALDNIETRGREKEPTSFKVIRRPSNCSKVGTAVELL